MAATKKYFHDRLVLLLLAASAFLAVVGSLLILLRLDGSRTDGYIIQYRSNLGLSGFETGGLLQILGFIAFLLLVLVLHTLLSMRVYHLRRQAAIVILGLGLLLLVLSIVVSNALLLLR